MNQTQLVIDRRQLYTYFFHSKMINDYVGIKVIKMPQQNHRKAVTSYAKDQSKGQ